MKTYHKTVSNLFKDHYIKWLVIVLMTLIAVALSTGLGGISSQIRNNFNDELASNNYTDIILKSKNPFGFTDDDYNNLINDDNIESVKKVFTYDYQNITLYSLDFDNQVNSTIKLVEGNLPINNNEVVIEKPHDNSASHKIGDVIDYVSDLTQGFEVKLTISGFVINNYYDYKEKYPNLIDDNFEIDTIIYVDSKTSIINIPIVTDYYIKYNHDLHRFEDSYLKYIDDEVNKLPILLGNDNYEVLTQEEMASIIVLEKNAHKMDLISVVFPLFFTLVILIITASTMTKLINEERFFIANFLSLGYPKRSIKIKYYLFSITSILLGSLLGMFLGFYTLSTLIYNAFSSILRMPTWTARPYLEVGIYVSLIILLGVIIIVASMLSKIFKESPADLQRPKAPKVGKKIFLEYIPFIWKRLKFKYKSSIRNLFRYKLNFIMTTLSIFGSVVLLFAGLGLLENAFVINDGTQSSIKLISLIVLVSAAAISILVTYHLTNMNIDYRKKEIASLRVLGYHRHEAGMYIYREILMMASIGIILGLPTGYFAIDFIFNYIEYGSLDNITFITWVTTSLGSLLFVVISALLLYPKLTKINMAEALKTID